MNKALWKKPATGATAATPTKEVERTFFTLPATVWAAIDLQRRNTGMSAAQYITSLVLKAAK